MLNIYINKEQNSMPTKNNNKKHIHNSGEISDSRNGDKDKLSTVYGTVSNFQHIMAIQLFILVV